jgi:nucleotide-binding universal stress UspA family protein
MVNDGDLASLFTEAGLRKSPQTAWPFPHSSYKFLGKTPPFKSGTNVADKRRSMENKMLRIERILCPTDLSRESADALRYAVALARAYNAKLFLLNCTKFKSAGEEPESKHLSMETARAFQGGLCCHLGLAAFNQINWEPLAIKNVQDVGEAIAHQAAKHKIDLIVMRSRRRPYAALLLGSTAETVSRTAPCPVLVTHPQECEWVGLSTGEIVLQRILVAYDFSSDAEVALNYGLSFAQEYQTELHLLHILTKAEPEEPELAWTARVTESAYPGAARKLQRAISKEVFLWCQVTTAVRFGKPYQEVLAYAKEHNIDLICMGAGGTEFTLGALLGSNVDRVLRQAPCPVLVTRPVKAD